MSTRARHQPWFLEGVGIELRVHWRVPGSAFCAKHESAYSTGYRGHCFDCEREEFLGELRAKWESEQLRKVFWDPMEHSNLGKVRA